MPNIELIHEELVKFQRTFFQKVDKDLKQINFMKKIEISNLSFNYPETSKKILSNIKMTINFGETIGIIGKSGSGKSTLVDLIIGLNIPQEGTIEVDGENINNNYRI